RHASRAVMVFARPRAVPGGRARLPYTTLFRSRGDEREDLLPRREAGDEVVELGEEVLEHGVSFLVVMAPASPRTAPRGRARCHRPGCASHGSPVTDVRRRGVTPST